MPTKRKNKTVNYNKNKNKNSIHIKIDNSRKTNYKKSNAQQQARPQGFNFISQPTPAQQQPIILNIPGFNPIPNSTPTIPTHSPTTTPIVITRPSRDEIRTARESILKPSGVTPSRSIGEKKMETSPLLEKVSTPLKTGGVDETPSIGSKHNDEDEEYINPRFAHLFTDEKKDNRTEEEKIESYKLLIRSEGGNPNLNKLKTLKDYSEYFDQLIDPEGHKLERKYLLEEKRKYYSDKKRTRKAPDRYSPSK